MTEDLTRDEVRGMAQTLPGAVVAYRVDDGLRRLFVSEAALELIGTSAGGSVVASGDDALDVVVPEDRARVMSEINQGIASGQDFDSYYRLVRPDGPYVWIHAEAHRLGSMDGEPVILCTLIDDTLENGNIAELVELSESATYVIDAATHEILYINEACMRLFGNRRPRRGETCFSFKHGFDTPCQWCPLAGVEGETSSLDNFYQEGTGTWQQYDFRRIRWFGHVAWAVYAHDVTRQRNEQTRLEETLAREERLVGYLKVLNEPGTFASRIDDMLAELGGNLGADRAYIFRAEGDDATITNEWCREGVPAAKESFQGVDGAFSAGGWMTSGGATGASSSPTSKESATSGPRSMRS